MLNNRKRAHQEQMDHTSHAGRGNCQSKSTSCSMQEMKGIVFTDKDGNVLDDTKDKQNDVENQNEPGITGTKF